MGNSSSAAHHPHPHHGLQGQPQRWTHSYPRATSTAASAAASGGLKVLPERVPGQRLRVTNNGAILQNGGTISGRRPSVGNLPRQRSSSQGSHHESKRSLYGSEPDLRYTGREFHHQPYSNDSPAKLRISRSRKKYKAPPAPHINGNAIDSSSPDSYQHWEMSGGGSGGGETAAPSRRLRLFKTRAETKRRGNEEAVTQHSFGQGTPSPGPLQRSLSSPQFQAELLEAAERLRPVREPPVGRAAEETPPRSPELRSIENMSKTDRARNAFRSSFDASHASNHKSHGSNHKSRTSSNENKPVSSAVQRTNELMEELQCRTRSKINKQTLDHRTRGEGSTGRESTPEPQVPRKTPAKNKSKDWESSNGPSKQISPVKTFYFGMGESPTRNEREEVDRFAASLHQRVPRPGSKSNSRPINTSGSDSLSSENNDENGSHGISLQLRPILPRKQLDIPRFSPTAAWRLLSALESSPPSEEDDLVPLEERIPVPLHLVNHPGQPDKSGDSGISGDDSPQHQDSTHNSQIAWTPQQDLEETSSDGGLESAPVSPESQSLPAAKFSPRFSLSLPRDDRLALYTHADKISEEAAEPDSFHSLKKLKRSMSGALGRAGGVIKESQGQESLPLDGNWVLSRSVPNSLNNGHSSLQRWASNSTPSSPEQDEEGALTSLVKQPSFSYLATGGHFMYLPEYSLPQKFIQQEYSPASMPLPVSMSKSCEDLSRGNDKEKLSSSIIRALEKPRSRSGRKFTFQSTVRQIERRRLAEKLSREAEQKERQRLSELEAMRRVEEEFQRKREREKADIRQQLRLFSLSQGKRDQPDGADPPSPLPPPATQVLSEFQQSRREYRDFRQNNHRSGHTEPDVMQNAEPNHKRAMIHPQVVYQMPKSTQVYVNPHLHSNGSGVGSDNGGGGGGGGVGGVSTPRSSSSDNYRRDFAQGALPHSLVSSDSELSQPNTRPTSRNRRSRSASPQRKISDTSDDTSCDAGEIRITQINVIERVARNLNDCFKTTGEFLNASDAADYPMEYMNNSFGSNVADDGDELTENNQTKTVESREVGEESPSTTRFNIGSAQPFVRGKSYRPIVFNPSINKVAQIAS